MRRRYPTPGCTGSATFEGGRLGVVASGPTLGNRHLNFQRVAATSGYRSAVLPQASRAPQSLTQASYQRTLERATLV
jgi:hypothetical protein